MAQRELEGRSLKSKTQRVYDLVIPGLDTLRDLDKVEFGKETQKNFAQRIEEYLGDGDTQEVDRLQQQFRVPMIKDLYLSSSDDEKKEIKKLES